MLYRAPAAALMRPLQLRGGAFAGAAAAAAGKVIPETAVQAPIMQIALYMGTLMSALSGCGRSRTQSSESGVVVVVGSTTPSILSSSDIIKTVRCTCWLLRMRVAGNGV